MYIYIYIDIHTYMYTSIHVYMYNYMCAYIYISAARGGRGWRKVLAEEGPGFAAAAAAPGARGGGRGPDMRYNFSNT